MRVNMLAFMACAGDVMFVLRIRWHPSLSGSSPCAHLDITPTCEVVRSLMHDVLSVVSDEIRVGPSTPWPGPKSGAFL